MESKLRSLWVNAGGVAPNDWNFSALEDLLLTPKSISVGVMYPGKHIEGGIPLIKVGDVANGAVVKIPDFCVSASVDEEYKRTRLKGKELLLTLVGNPGDCVIVTLEMAGWNAARALAVLTLKDDGLRYWLRMILLSNPSKHIIDSRLNTTVQRTLNLKDVRQLPIPLPPKRTRDYLCNFAKNLEQKIELNRQTNQTLEQMAQALFKSWFVDFDPVIDNALEAGNTIPDELQDRAERRQQQLAKPDHQPLPDDIHQLFPSEFELTEALGWVPMGWKSTSIFQVMDIIYGAPFSSKQFNDKGEGLPIIRIRDLKTGEPKNWSQENHPKKTLIQAGDIIAGMDAEFRATLWSGNTGYLNQRLFLARPKLENMSKLFIQYALHPLLEFQENTQVGTTVAHLGKKEIDKFNILMPTKSVMGIANNVLNPIHEKIVASNESIKSLTKLRDTLLPKLISGELRLPSEVVEQELADSRA